MHAFLSIKEADLDERGHYNNNTKDREKSTKN